MELQSHILVIDNNPETVQLLKKILSDYKINFTNNADEALHSISNTAHELIVTAIGKPNIDGFKIVEQIQELDNNDIPILYLSYDETDLADKGIDYCKVHTLSQPFGDKIFITKVSDTIKLYQQKQEQKSEVAEAVNAMLGLQNDNAKIYDICRFLQHSFFCKDIHALCEQLFIVTRSFGINCTLYVHSEKNSFFISDGVIHGEQINNDILHIVRDEDRIFQFGNNRAVFNWDCASLLVNKVGDDIDNLAMLMDGFEMGFKAIESVDDFNVLLEKYQHQNFELQVQVARIVEDVATNITDELNLLGATTMLTEEQENSLVTIAEQGRKDVDVLFSEGLQLDKELSQIMTKMRTQSENSSSAEDTSSDDDGIDFF